MSTPRERRDGSAGDVKGRLRSREWFAGDDEVAVIHRVAMRNAGYDLSEDESRPVIGVLNSASDLNPCNLPLTALAQDVRRGVTDAGGIAVELPVMSLGEDLMKPTAMLYRNLLAMEVEEYLRTYPLDGVVLMANCDKSVPGAVMGAASANLPFLVVTAGARPATSVFRGRPVATGTDLWRAWEEHRSGRMDDAEWAELEKCLACGQGACNSMGTASSMAILTETLGLSLPGTSVIPADSPDRNQAAYDSGRRLVAMVADHLVPSQMLTDAAFRNAARVLHAVGGSTNAIVHLLAIAGRTASSLSLDEIGRLGAGIPVLADIEPSGRLLIQDFHAAGGVPALLRLLGDAIEVTAMSAIGKPWSASLPPEVTTGGALRDVADCGDPDGAFAVVRGSLAPRGAVLKTSAASPDLFQHSGPALVFRSYEDMRERIDDPDLPVTPETVLVLAGAGPVGAPGMPEWGMIPIPGRLAAAGVTDMVRVTDARMSGTSFGTCILHVAPEAAVGGPLALVRDGDLIRVDVRGGRLDLEVPKDELDRRRAAWRPPTSAHLRGWPALYQAHVCQADTGCDFDFLRAPTPEHRKFVPPVIGRS